jgi:hypothetical protein
MSATAFQRLRREAAVAAKKQPVREDPALELTNKQIKEKLDVIGIEYDARANKETLIKLLKGAE